MYLRYLVRLVRALLVVGAVALAAVPLLVLVDLSDGGTGYGLCDAGLESCRNPYGAALQLAALLTVGLAVVLAGFRITNRMLRRLERPTAPPVDR